MGSRAPLSMLCPTAITLLPRPPLPSTAPQAQTLALCPLRHGQRSRNTSLGDEPAPAPRLRHPPKYHGVPGAPLPAGGTHARCRGTMG